MLKYTIIYVLSTAAAAAADSLVALDDKKLLPLSLIVGLQVGSTLGIADC